MNMIDLLWGISPLVDDGLHSRWMFLWALQREALRSEIFSRAAFPSALGEDPVLLFLSPSCLFPTYLHFHHPEASRNPNIKSWVSAEDKNRERCLWSKSPQGTVEGSSGFCRIHLQSGIVIPKIKTRQTPMRGRCQHILPVPLQQLISVCRIQRGLFFF